MPDFIVTSPEGKKFRVTAPEGATQEQALAFAQSQFQQAPSPVEGNSFLDNVKIGAGKTLTDLAQGVKQRINEYRFVTGKGGTIQDVARDRVDAAEKRRIDAPIMETGGGKVGAIGTGALAAFIPGVNTLGGATAMGAAFGAAQPTTSNAETLTNVGLGGGLGLAGQYAGQQLSSIVSRVLAARRAAASAARESGSVRDQLVREARDAGYVVPPSSSNPTALNTTLESIGGKAATQQAASLRNQRVTNNLIRKELGLSESAPITVKTLGDLRKQAGKVYQEIADAGEIIPDGQYLDDLGGIEQSIAEVAADFPEANVGSSDQITKLVNSLLRDKFTAKGASEYVKQLRHKASANLKSFDDPEKRALGFAQRDAAAALEEQIMRHLRANGKEALADSFDQARRTIAKTYSVEAALNEATGNVNARKLASQLARNKPLSGGMETAARFAQAFPKAMDEVTHSPGVSALDAYAGAGGAVVSGSPLALAAPYILRPAARSAILSRPFQNSRLQPNYAPNTGLLRIIQTTANQGRTAAPGLLSYQN